MGYRNATSAIIFPLYVYFLHVWEGKTIWELDVILNVSKQMFFETSISPISCHLLTSSHIYSVCIMHGTSCTNEYRELFLGEHSVRSVTLTIALSVVSSLMLFQISRNLNSLYKHGNFQRLSPRSRRPMISHGFVCVCVCMCVFM